MFKGHIQSGQWDDGVLELSNMPIDFVLSAREVVVMDESEYADLIAERDKWKSAYEEDDIRTNGLCDKVTKLQDENKRLKALLEHSKTQLEYDELQAENAHLQKRLDYYLNKSAYISCPKCGCLIKNI